MAEPRRYNPPMVRATRCRARRNGADCGGEVIAFGEEDYDALDGKGPFRARMWHCRRCGAAAVQEIENTPGAGAGPAGSATPTVTQGSPSSVSSASDQRPASPLPAPALFDSPTERREAR